MVQIPVKKRAQYLRPAVPPPVKVQGFRRPADDIGPAAGGDQLVKLPKIPEEHRRMGSVPALVKVKSLEIPSAGNLGGGSGSGTGSEVVAGKLGGQGGDETG
ncbi:hypothetical protein HDV00_008234, partial [Rhizophlyctis rosea]